MFQIPEVSKQQDVLRTSSHQWWVVLAIKVKSRKLCFQKSIFKMLQGIFRKAISKCFGVFLLEFEFSCHLDLSQQAFGITVVLWIPIRGIGLLVVLWTTVWCYTKQPTFWAGMSLSLSGEEPWVWLLLLVVASLIRNICWIGMLISELKSQAMNLSLRLQLQRLVSSCLVFLLCLWEYKLSLWLLHCKGWSYAG